LSKNSWTSTCNLSHHSACTWDRCLFYRR